MPANISDVEYISEILKKWNKSMMLFLLFLIFPAAFSTFAAIIILPVFKGIFWLMIWMIVICGLYIFGTLLLEKRFARTLTVREAQALHNEKILEGLARADRLTLRRIQGSYKKMYPHLDSLESFDDKPHPSNGNNH